MLYKKIVISAFLLCLVGTTVAYDVVAHRVIAHIAYNNLSKKARKQTDNVLGKRGIVYTASWADEIKSDDAYSYSYEWHFQNLAENLTEEDIKNLYENPLQEGMHLFFALQEMIKRLENDKKDAEALKFLVHFVGDLHQPLHLGRKEDKGANTIRMDWFGRKTNLHAVWDGSLVAYRNMSSDEYALYLEETYEKQKKQELEMSVLQSIQKTYLLANEIYAYDMSNKNNYHYAYRFMGDLDEQLYRAGIQLANILNKIFK